MGEQRLPAEELNRVRRIDATYRATARATGLMSENKPDDIEEAMREQQMRRALAK